MHVGHITPSSFTILFFTCPRHLQNEGVNIFIYSLPTARAFLPSGVFMNSVTGCPQ